MEANARWIPRSRRDVTLHLARFRSVGLDREDAEAFLLHQVAEEPILHREELVRSVTGLPQPDDTRVADRAFERRKIAADRVRIDRGQRCLRRTQRRKRRRISRHVEHHGDVRPIVRPRQSAARHHVVEHHRRPIDPQPDTGVRFDRNRLYRGTQPNAFTPIRIKPNTPPARPERVLATAVSPQRKRRSSAIRHRRIDRNHVLAVCKTKRIERLHRHRHTQSRYARQS